MDKIEEILTRGVANVIPSKQALKKLLKDKKRLDIYLGIDPTATRIHLGNAVPLRKLQAFAELGHSVTFLIGDFTALIGDTSDKDSERPVLTTGQIEENFKTYKKQAEKILDFSKAKVRFNSEWLSKLSFSEIVKLCQHFSFGDFAGRELIRKRLDAGKYVGLHEALYPVMQGYDSYFLDTDVQLGGTDQTFNMQTGRSLQKDLRNKESFIIANEFLTGTDGRKMSKSWGNTIWLDDEPNDMYAKTMAITDGLILQYFTLATNTPLSEISAIESQLKSDANPMLIKKKLAFRIISELHGKKKANSAQENFENTVQGNQLPPSIPTISLLRSFVSTASVLEVLIKSNTASSKSEAKRVIEQGGVRVNKKIISDPNEPFALYVKNGEAIIQKGKTTFIKIKPVPI